MILWSIQMYWKFAVIIAITSVVSVTASVWETRRVIKYYEMCKKMAQFPFFFCSKIAIYVTK